MVAFGHPLYTAKKANTNLDVLNGGLRPPTIHSKEGSSKPGYTEWQPSAAHRTQQRSNKKSDALNGGLRAPTPHSEEGKLQTRIY